MSDDRPVPVPRRPRPAPDEAVDPVVPSAAPDRTPPGAPPDAGGEFELPVDIPRRRRGLPTVQVNARLPPDVAELVDRVVAETQATKSEVIESALLHAYKK